MTSKKKPKTIYCFHCKMDVPEFAEASHWYDKNSQANVEHKKNVLKYANTKLFGIPEDGLYTLTG